MNLIFFRPIELSTQKGRKLASMRVAQRCKFIFWGGGLIIKKILHLFLIIQFEFHYSYRKQTFILTLFNAGLFQTLNDAVIIMKFFG